MLLLATKEQKIFQKEFFVRITGFHLLQFMSVMSLVFALKICGVLSRFGWHCTLHLPCCTVVVFKEDGAFPSPSLPSALVQARTSSDHSASTTKTTNSSSTPSSNRSWTQAARRIRYAGTAPHVVLRKSKRKENNKGHVKDREAHRVGLARGARIDTGGETVHWGSCGQATR